MKKCISKKEQCQNHVISDVSRNSLSLYTNINTVNEQIIDSFDDDHICF